MVPLRVEVALMILISGGAEAREVCRVGEICKTKRQSKAIPERQPGDSCGEVGKSADHDLSIAPMLQPNLFSERDLAPLRSS